MANTRLSHRVHSGVNAMTLPGVYTLAFVILILLWKALEWPSPEDTLLIISHWLNTYGLPIVAAAAFIEGLAVITLYFPGSTVIITSVIAARTGDDSFRALTTIVLAASLAFLLSAQLNYFVGYHGLHRLINGLGGAPALRAAQARYARHGAGILIPSFIHPTLGGIMAVSAGMARLKWRRFTVISAASIVIWNVGWGAAVYLAAPAAQTAAANPMVVLSFLIGWCIAAFLWGATRMPAAVNGSVRTGNHRNR